MRLLFLITVVLLSYSTMENSGYKVFSRVEHFGISWLFAHGLGYIIPLLVLVGGLLVFYKKRCNKLGFLLALFFLLLERILFLTSAASLTNFQTANPSLFMLGTALGEFAFWFLIVFTAYFALKRDKPLKNNLIKVLVVSLIPILYTLLVVLFNPIYVDDFQNNGYKLTDEEKERLLPLFESQIDIDKNNLVMIFSSTCYYCAQHSPIMKLSATRASSIEKYYIVILGDEESRQKFIKNTGVEFHSINIPAENILNLSMGTFPTYYLFLKGEVYLYQGEEMSYRALGFVESNL